MRRLPVVLALAAVVAFTPLLLAQENIDVRSVPVKWTQVVVSDGAALYAELCAVCHGAEGKGDGPAAPALAASVPDLTMLALTYDGVYPSEEVEMAISRRKDLLAHGTLEMPIWGRILEDSRPEYKMARREAFASLRIHNLVAYIETLQVPAH